MSLDDLYDALHLDRPAWWGQAACLGLGTEHFFPNKGRSGTLVASRARTICAGCPVQVECGLAGTDERFGIWGGMGRKARQAGEARLQSERRDGAIPHGTYAGYRAETDRGLTLCDECRAAYRRYRAEYRANNPAVHQALLARKRAYRARQRQAKEDAA